MAIPHGYYGVIVSVEPRVIDGDRMVNVLCEEGCTKRICASVKRFDIDELTKGTIVIYSRGYYWKLEYLNTDIKYLHFRNVDLIAKAFLRKEPLTEEEKYMLEMDDVCSEIYENLSNLNDEAIGLWFDAFYFRNFGDDVLITTDDDCEMASEYYCLNAQK